MISESKPLFLKAIENMKLESMKEGVNQIIRCTVCGKTQETDKLVFEDMKYKNTICFKCSSKEMSEKLLILFNQKVRPIYRTDKLKMCDNKELEKTVRAIIFGGFGTGKTWLSYSLAKKLYVFQKIKSFEITTEFSMIEDIKAGMMDGSKRQITDKYESTDFLVVDEVGKINDSEYNKAHLFDILNTRHEYNKRTILICNAKSKSELPSILPTAILDRYRECIIELDGKSKRYADE